MTAPGKPGPLPPRKYFAYYYGGEFPKGPLMECSKDRFESGDTSTLVYLSLEEHEHLLEQAKREARKEVWNMYATLDEGDFHDWLEAARKADVPKGGGEEQ